MLKITLAPVTITKHFSLNDIRLIEKLNDGTLEASEFAELVVSVVLPKDREAFATALKQLVEVSTADKRSQAQMLEILIERAHVVLTAKSNPV